MCDAKDNGERHVYEACGILLFFSSLFFFFFSSLKKKKNLYHFPLFITTILILKLSRRTSFTSGSDYLQYMTKKKAQRIRFFLYRTTKWPSFSYGYEGQESQAGEVDALYFSDMIHVARQWPRIQIKQKWSDLARSITKDQWARSELILPFKWFPHHNFGPKNQ